MLTFARRRYHAHRRGAEACIAGQPITACTYRQKMLARDWRDGWLTEFARKEQEKGIAP